MNKNIKIGTKVKIIKSIPKADQTEQDVNNKIVGLEGEVIQHWKQKDNDYWDKGQIQISIIAIGTVILNNGEYEVL